MATYQSAYTGVEIDFAVGSMIGGATNPTPTTVGAVGQIYRNTINGMIFKCIKVEGIVYTWVEINNVTIGTTQPTGGIWLEEV